MFQPRLVNDKLSQQYNLEYSTVLQEALFTHFEKPYKAPETPLLLKQDNDINGKYFCQYCKDSFYHAASLDEHVSRGSWILGYWCKNCFNECEHLPGQKKYCYKCMKLQHQKYKALQTRGLNKDIDPGVVKIFFNPCQLLQHMQIHRMEEISIHQLMLLPFPTGIGTEYFPHLKMISEALIDFMFLKNIHIVDWLWKNKIHKWWRMAKGDNPVANIIKKYPFEVQQIKQLLNSNTKANLESRHDNISVRKKKIQDTKDYSKKLDSMVSNCTFYNEISTSLTDINVIEPVKSSNLLSLRICQFPEDEQNNQIYCLNNSETTLNTSAEKKSQNLISLSAILNNKITIKKFPKHTDLSLVESSTDARTFLNKKIYWNKHGPKIISSIPPKSTKFTTLIKSSEISQKVRDNKIVCFRGTDKINRDPFYSYAKQTDNSQKLSIIKFNKVQFLKNYKTTGFQGLDQCDLRIAQSQDKKNEAINQFHQPINEPDPLIDSQKQFTKFDSGADSPNLEKFDPVSKNDFFSVVQKESISNISSTNRNSNFIISNKVEKDVLAFKENSCLPVSTKTVLEQLFSKEDLEFLTVTKNEKGKSFLSISENVTLQNNAEYKKRMQASLSKINKNKIHLKIGHIKTLSRKYSEKFDVSNDEIIEGHNNLISILENVAKNIELPAQSTEDYFVLSYNAMNSHVCSTCHKVMRLPGYLIGFSKSLSEQNHCLCCDFICFKCNIFQGNKERFDSHLKYHESKYPYTCPECKLDFPSSQNLEVHMWTKCFHQFTKRFLFCTICEIGGFCSLEAIINHFIVMHSVKMAVCSLCCMVFEYKRYCIGHIKKGHPEVKSYTEPLQLILCQLDDRIMSIECYNDHVMSHKCIQEITLYYCNLCLDESKKFKSLESIKTHTYECHLTQLSNLISENSLIEILSMEDIKLIFQKQLKNNSCADLEASTGHPVTAASTSALKNTLNGPSQEKCNKLKSDENRQSILGNNISLFHFSPDDSLNRPQSLAHSNNFATNTMYTETSSSKQCANEYMGTGNKNSSKTHEFDKNLRSHTSTPSSRTEKKILAQTQGDDILNLVSTENDVSTIMKTNSSFTQVNERYIKKTDISSELVGINIEDISSNVSLELPKGEEKLSENFSQSCIQCNNTTRNRSYSDVHKSSFHSGKMIEMDLLKNTSNYDALVKNNTEKFFFEDAIVEEVVLVHQSDVHKDIVKDINEKCITCANLSPSVGETIESIFNRNKKHNKEQIDRSIKTDDLNQMDKIDALPNKNFELTSQSLNQNNFVKTSKEIAKGNYLNCDDRVAKTNYLENVLTNIAKTNTMVKESNDCTSREALSEKRNKKFEVDITNSTTYDIVIQESNDVKKRDDSFSNKNIMILSKNNVGHSTKKGISHLNKNEKLKIDSIIELNLKMFNDDKNSKNINIPTKNVSSIGEISDLKLLESQRTSRVDNKLSLSLLLENTTSHCKISDYSSKIESGFGNIKSYESSRLKDGYETCQKSIGLIQLSDDFDERSDSSNRNVDNSFYDLESTCDNNHAKIQASEYNHIKIQSMLGVDIALNDGNKEDYLLLMKTGVGDNRSIESDIKQAKVLTKSKDVDNLPLHVKSSESIIALKQLSNRMKSENSKNMETRKFKNLAKVEKRIDVEQIEYANISFESTDAISNYNMKFDQNCSLSTKEQDTDVSNHIKAHDIQLDLNSQHLLIQKENLEEDEKSLDRLKISNSSTFSLETKKEINSPPTELKNLSLTDDEKINLSKTSLRINNLKFSGSQKSAANEKKLRSRIPSQINNKNKKNVKKRKSGSAVFREFYEKNDKIQEKQGAVIKLGNTANRKLTKKKQNISNFDAKIKSKADLYEGNALGGKKVIMERFKQTKILPVRRNLKKYWPYLFKHDSKQIINEKSKKGILQPQISLPKFSKISSQTNQSETNKASASTIANKSRIGFFSNECDLVNICQFKCHLCGDLINTTWHTLNDHYSTKHSENYDVCNVSLKLFRVSGNDLSRKSDIKMSNKRKSIEILSTGLKKRKRRSAKTLMEKSSDISDRTSGLYVQLEPIIDDEGNFKCKKCEKRCTNMIDLRRHIYNYHRISKKNLICLECGENFVVSPSLQMHLKAFHEIDDPISYMNKYPDYASDMADFESGIEVTVANQCHVCMAVFKDNLAVDKHLRVHGMAFLNKKRIEAKKAKLTASKKQDNNYNELSRGLQLIINEQTKEEFFLNTGSTDLAS